MGRYTVLDCIGAGGMGVVYEAYDPELDRRVALKLLNATRDGSNVSEAQGELLGEAKSLARLSHPNVVAVYDAGRVADGVALGAVYLAMELVEGKTLRRWVDDQHDLQAAGWREIVEVFTQAGHGLAAAHTAGVIHRDFKPQNVLVSGSGRRQRVRVADFGLAVLEPTAASGPASGQSGELFPRVAGTPAYMAPEQLAGDEVGPHADQFAFCVALFEALFGSHPFKRETLIELADAVLHAEPELPAQSPRVPAWLRRVVLQGLARSPKDRHPSMDALVAQLSRDRFLWVRHGLLGAAALTILGGAAYAVHASMQPGEVRITVTNESNAPIEGASVVIGSDVLVAAGDCHEGDITAGTYTLHVSAKDHVTQTSAIEIERGGHHALTVTLRHEQGHVDLDVEPRGATVLVDGLDRGSKLVGLALDTGAHEVVVQK
ncbi:MAG: protein kinase, partial [Myxococcota bacterium]